MPMLQVEELGVLEMTIGWRDQVSDFKYNVSLNFTTLKNEVSDLGYDKPYLISGQSISKPGEPLAMFYLRKNRWTL